MAPPNREVFAINEDFSSGMDNWWVEGGDRVWVEDKRLMVSADAPEKEGGGVCTVWCKTPLPSGSFQMDFDAHVIRSSLQANNINLFFCYSDPSGASLQETHEDRSAAEYSSYHSLNGYIITFLNDFRAEGGLNRDGSTKARVRMRRCPGFHLLTERFVGECREGRTYRLSVTHKGKRIAFAVDGEEVLDAIDDDPLHGGLLGLRTFRTALWWSNVHVSAL